MPAEPAPATTGGPRARTVHAELRGSRLAFALTLLLLVPAVLAALALSYQRPDLPPGPAAYAPLPLEKTENAIALQGDELARSRVANRVGRELAAPDLVDPSRLDPPLTGPAAPGDLPTLVLAAREQPYSLAEVAQLEPAAFGTAEGGLLVRANLEVPAGATLVLDAQTPDVRLASSAAGFTTLISRGGAVRITGDEATEVRVSSWDETTGAPDTDKRDGRSFVLMVGGRMDVDRARVEHLGFGTGTSSGMAWRGAPPTLGVAGPKAEGDVTRSVFANNWFGAYTYEAQGMRWAGNTFADNDAYGFDPHDLSNDFVVEQNVAHGNGRHGFIFSRGCDRNVLRDNVAYDNRGHGFMIDDGRTEDAPFADANVLPSNDNLIEGNRAYDNDGSGIEIEGGTGNVVRDNLVEGNHVGIRIKNDAEATITGNTVNDSRLYGVDVLDTARSAEITGNTITGGWASIGLGDEGLATREGNTVSGASAPLVIAGTSVRESTVLLEVSKVLRWNPLLVLWGLILGVPLLVWLVRGVPARMGVTRRLRAQGQV